MTTPEQDVMMKLVHLQKINNDDEDILKEATIFYKEAFKSLKAINLSELADEDLEEIFSFLKAVFNMKITIQNKINFYYVYRVTSVTDSFLENGKVRDVKFIKNAPLDIIQKMGVYGRANSPKSTIFYCAFQPGVAVFETKPKINDRIIIAEWFNEGAKDFISYPITNNKTIPNKSLESATKAFQDSPIHREMVDVVAMELEIPEDFEGIPKPINSCKFDDFNLSVADDVFVLGYPYSFTGGGYFPIWKRGSVATDLKLIMKGFQNTILIPQPSLVCQEHLFYFGE